MGKTKIEWAHFSFNPWIGCTRVSRGCVNCYAEAMMDARYRRVDWGPHGSRSRTSTSYWRQPLKWDREAAAAGERRRVFCASLADVFDNHSSITSGWRGDLWHLIARTPNLDWLLLTKRPENWPFMLPVAEPREPREPFHNIRLGVTIEDQDAMDERGPILQFAADLGWPTFVSYEPALGPVDWMPLFEGRACGWLIAGSESGRDARPYDADWFRSARDQCQVAGVPFFLKQYTIKGRKTSTPELDGRTWTELPHSVSERDPNTGRFVGKKTAGRLLDGVEHNGMPERADA